MNSTKYGSNLGSADTANIGPSPQIWNKFPTLEIVENPAKGIHIFERFDQVPGHPSTSGADFTGGFGRWALFLSTGATVVGVTNGNKGGGIVISSDGDNEAAILASLAGSMLLASGQRTTRFEIRFKVSTVADTKFDFFAGLCEGITPTAIVPITATAGTLADKNLIGFHRRGDDGDQIDFSYKADGQTLQAPATDMISGGLAADTWVKMGFVYDANEPNSSKRLKLFINGIEQSTYVTAAMIAAATFPNDVYLSPCFGLVNATGTTPGNATVNWVRVGHEF